MKVYSVSGIEEINAYLTQTMFATLSALEESGKLSKEDADEFRNTHVAQLLTDADCWQWIRNILKIEPNYNKIVILKHVS